VTEVRKCSQCGAPLAADAPEGHCPRCVLELVMGMGESTEATGQTLETGQQLEHLDVEEKIGRYKLLQRIG